MLLEARRQCTLTVFHPRECGQRDRGQLLRTVTAAPDLAQQLVAVLVRHADVTDQDIGVALEHATQGGLGAARLDHARADLAQYAAGELARIVIVFDE